MPRKEIFDNTDEGIKTKSMKIRNGHVSTSIHSSELRHDRFSLETSCCFGKEDEEMSILINTKPLKNLPALL
jgi:hypothetical protein